MNTKREKQRKIIQKLVAMLLVFAMTIGNFALVGERAIAYVVEAVATSNANVEIVAYFVNEDGETVSSIDEAIDRTDLKLKIEVTVKNIDGYGGYFEGTLGIEDSNFKLVDDEEISIYVSSGSTETVEKEIEYLETDSLTEEYLSKESKVVINGVYKNSEGEYEITGETTVTVNWKTPDDTQAILATKVLTNEEYQIEEENKRILQLLVGSKLTDNDYPVRSTVISVEVPEGVEEVEVHKRTTEATNGNAEFGEENYTLENGILTITIENNGASSETNEDTNENSDEISWSKNAQDILVVTYKYSEGTDLTGTEINLNSTVTTLDGTQLTAETTASVEEEIDGIVTSSISVGETEIYKGKIYVGEERSYNTTTQINIDNAEATEKVEVSLEEASFVIENDGEESLRSANITYTKTEISRDNFIEIFGEEGYIIIRDQDGNVVANITNESETDDNGNIVINYNDVTALEIETSKPQTEGILVINNEKTINSSGYTREQIEEFTGIREGTATITLLETETTASLSVETTSLSTTEDGQELNLRVTLETGNESKDLYKNPEIKITLPEQIEVTGARYRMLYGNGLEATGATVSTEDGKSVITITLDGEQTSYEGDAINGTIIDIVADVDVDKLATTSTEAIKLVYTNENIETFSGEEDDTIEIIAEDAIILTNNVDNEDVEIIGSDVTEEINLPVGSSATQETISMQIINNEGETISNIAVLGKLPTNEGNIELTSSVSSNVDAQIYYTQVENPTSDIENDSNGWTETPTTNAKSYLVVVDSLENAQSLSLSYTLSIEENLDYSIEEEASYVVTYTKGQSEDVQSVSSGFILFTTESGTDLEATITATVGGETLTDGDVVKAGEVIVYEVSVTNTSSEDISGVTITGNIPDNTKLVIVNEDYWEMGDLDTDVEGEDRKYFLEQDDIEVKYEDVTIGAGETVTYTYMVKVDSDVADNTQTTAKVTVEYNDDTIEATVTHTLGTANLVVTIMPMFTLDELKSKYTQQYQILVENVSGENLENVAINININDILEISSVTYHYSISSDVSVEKETEFTIEEVPADDTVRVIVVVNVNDPTEDMKYATIVATAEEGENIYRSNFVSEKVASLSASAELSAITSSENTTGYVYKGDTITYTAIIENDGDIDATSLKIRDVFSNYLQLDSITINGDEITDYSQSPQYTVGEDGETLETTGYSYIEIEYPLNVGESIELVINATVSDIFTETTLEIPNWIELYNEMKIGESETITYYYGSIYVSDTENPDDSGETGDSGDTGDSGSGSTNTPGSSSSYYEISGTVWEDSNSDGQRSSNEVTLSGITVYALNVSTNEIVDTAITSSTGFYTLSNLPEGNYVVVFEYDTNAYTVTTYQADGVDDSRNSDAIRTAMTINGETKDVAATDIITLSSDMANIDLGLTQAKIFDLDIEKFVSSITVSNSRGTTVYDQEDGTTLAQVQIASSVLSGTSVVVEYTIRVTNNGEIAGYATSIVDYLPSSLSFSTSLNSDWYQSGEYIYNSSLATTLIQPGESVDLTLIVTKTMTNSNTGLINNRAGIDDSYNSLGVADSDSSDIGSADVIIGIQTGPAVTYVVTIICIIIVVCGLAFIVNKKFVKKDEEI